MMQIETVDMEPFQNYMKDVGYFKHQCYKLNGFNYRDAKYMWENATMEEAVNMIRGHYHIYNSGDE